MPLNNDFPVVPQLRPITFPENPTLHFCACAFRSACSSQLRPQTRPRPSPFRRARNEDSQKRGVGMLSDSDRKTLHTPKREANIEDHASSRLSLCTPYSRCPHLQGSGIIISLPYPYSVPIRYPQWNRLDPGPNFYRPGSPVYLPFSSLTPVEDAPAHDMSL